MRIRIQHETTYRYAEPVRSAIQLLRLTPRSHAGQTVLRWSIDTGRDARLIRREDWYGNIMHSLFADGSIEEIAL
ncbi:transglutaminase family protein, partial [Corallococcus exiguus]|uniref:transglutaminase N-terminal domain-containing protein n=1 Tax=Corallococcus exiguus TaxID=83462 RepID=UPI0018432394|nr:transglutaminase family protein [Corallococcus exiguus]